MHPLNIFNKYLLGSSCESRVVLALPTHGRKNPGLGISAVNSDSLFISCVTSRKLFNLSELGVLNNTWSTGVCERKMSMWVNVLAQWLHRCGNRVWWHLYPQPDPFLRGASLGEKHTYMVRLGRCRHRGMSRVLESRKVNN